MGAQTSLSGREAPYQPRTEAPAPGTPWQKLQPLPTSHTEVSAHPYTISIRAAEANHLQSHRETDSWREVLKRTAKGSQILGCHWVYTYKLNKHGRLLKIKARLVIRGDQQLRDERDTYASTLAGMSFRTLMAIANRFDLELLQYDAVNAFVRVPLDEDVYMRMPPGYQKPGYILKLNKALYGLRRSPLLWQRHLEAGLKELGLERVAGENCCWMKGRIIFFFYVDDCVLCFPSECREEALSLVGALQKRYFLEGGEDLQWFLGIEVIRDRPTKRLWLSQSVYIDKVIKRLEKRGPRSKRQHTSPIRLLELLPHKDIASYADTNRYQGDVGSIMYGATMTRPDVALAASRLARFNQNPSPEHLEEAERAIEYLYAKRSLCLEFGCDEGGPDDGLVIASDASFADNTPDRKSSQAFAIKLFGGLIGWRANKQNTVTTSTTEAELLALSQAAKEAIFASRLITALRVDLSTKTFGDPTAPSAPAPSVRIQCDNQQTIRLVNEETIQLRTKLRHVDIHNHWLRQEAQEGRIQVEYTPTAELMADGFTKPLAGTRFEAFLKQLNMVDQTARLRALRDAELEKERLKGLDFTTEE